jgi:LAS superfamily LD-carboxypeptidase LdcB
MSRSNVIFIFIISLSLGLSFIHAQSGNTEKPIQVISSFSGAYSNKKEAPSTYLILKKRINLDPLIQDNNILRFVSKTTPLKDKSYTPNDLLPIAGSGIDEAGRTGYLRYEARISIGDMSKDFEANFHTPLVIISGYRSATYQQRMWDLGKCTDSLCAPPGHSEHQL